MWYIVLSFLLLFGFSACSGNPWEIQESMLIPAYFSIEAKHGFEIVYDPNPSKTIKESYISGSVILNGSYFWMTASGSYYPAGLWEHPWSTCCTLFPEDANPISRVPNLSDPNLTYIVGVSSGGVISIFPREAFKRNAWPYTYAFQAWPLILSWNILQSFWDSWHANEPHERTLLGVTISGKTYFFVFTTPKTLLEVGKTIQQQFLYDPITLLNLDGWPSTAYYDGIHGFRENEKLPILIRIQP